MKNQFCLALLTDFGVTDCYAGLLKAAAVSVFPQVPVIDLTHGVSPQNILQGAVMLEDSYSYFPARTIFVCVVDPGVGTSRKLLAVKTKDYYFLGPDNGLLAAVLRREKRAEVRSLENSKFFRRGSTSSTFHGRDILAPAAAHLAQSGGKIFSQLGPVLKKIKPLDLPQVQKSAHLLRGNILYFDHYGNAITNIKREDAPESFWRKAHGFTKKKNWGPVRAHYQESEGRPLFLFNSFSRLEMAVPGGSVERQLGLKAGDAVLLKGQS